VVATAVGGTREIVRDGTDGILVPAADPGEAAAAVQRLLTDETLRRAMSEAAAAHVARHFSLDGQVARLAAVMRWGAAAGVVQVPTPGGASRGRESGFSSASTRRRSRARGPGHLHRQPLADDRRQLRGPGAHA
jgi:hypothetical protein